jgi:hypothetical protein
MSAIKDVAREPGVSRGTASPGALTEVKRRAGTTAIASFDDEPSFSHLIPAESSVVPAHFLPRAEGPA